MRVTQATFSFLPEFSDDEIKLQLQYAIDNEWALSVEFTDGNVGVTADADRPAAPAVPASPPRSAAREARRRRAAQSADQGNLF